MLARETQSRKERSLERTCVGCREVAHPSAMLRLVLGPDGEVVPDLARGAFGRGAWVHARASCLESGARRGLAKAFKSGIRTTPEALHESLLAQAERRACALISAAKRAGKVAVGRTEVDSALEGGDVALVVVARDARSAIDSARVQRAIETGAARAFSDKERLGELLGKSEVGVLAILDQGVATALSEMLAVMMIPGPTAIPKGGKPEAPPSAPCVREDG
jgi:predicted RNA-binding protein YlxR (DUF448 family)/ribosomal protein L30E